MVSVPLPDVLWGRTLRRLESVLLHVGVHETARRNAWAAVCADRARARDRRAAERGLSRLNARPPDALPDVDDGAGRPD